MSIAQVAYHEILPTRAVARLTTAVRFVVSSTNRCLLSKGAKSKFNVRDWALREQPRSDSILGKERDRDYDPKLILPCLSQLEDVNLEPVAKKSEAPRRTCLFSFHRLRRSLRNL